MTGVAESQKSWYDQAQELLNPQDEVYQAMKKRMIILLLSSLFVFYTGHAQLQFSSLQEIWSYADQHNIQIITHQAAKSVADKSVQQAYAAVFPVISANGAFTDNLTIQSTLIPANLLNPAAPAGTYAEATFGKRYIYNAGGSAQFDLLNTKDWFAIKSEKLSREIAALNIAKLKADLHEQLANSFYSYLLLSKAEELSRENLQTATELYVIAKNKFTEGLVSEVTVNTALINEQKAAKSLDIAVENKQLQLNSIKLILNTSDNISISVDAATEPVFIADTVFAEDPNVKISYTQMLVSKTQWQSSKAAFAPTISAVYQYNTQIAASDFLKFGNSNTTPQQYWGLRLSMPIFGGNSKRYQVQKSKTDYTLKQKQYDNARLQSDINNQNILLAYNSSLNAFEKSKNILSLYQSNDLHAARRMNEGIISMDDRLKVYTDLITNQNEYLQSMSDYFIQHYRLQIRQTNLLQ